MATAASFLTCSHCGTGRYRQDERTRATSCDNAACAVSVIVSLDVQPYLDAGETLTTIDGLWAVSAPVETTRCHQCGAVVLADTAECGRCLADLTPRPSTLCGETFDTEDEVIDHYAAGCDECEDLHAPDCLNHHTAPIPYALTDLARS